MPSRFLYELAGGDDLPSGPVLETGGRRRRGLHLADLVADLRSRGRRPGRRREPRSTAPQHIWPGWRDAGVPGAHPADWFGLGDRSSDAPPVPARAAVSVSPSHVEAALTCGLRGVLERRGRRRGVRPSRRSRASSCTRWSAGLAAGLGADELTRHVDEHLARQSHLPPWQVERSRRALPCDGRGGAHWVESRGAGRTAVGSEVAVAADLPPETATTDRSGSPAGSTGSTGPPTGPGGRRLQDRRDRAQQGRGRGERPARHLPAGHRARRSRGGRGVRRRAGAGRSAAGGAELVYLRTGRPQLRVQDPPLAGGSRHLASRGAEAARQWSSSVVTAQENGRCDRCPVRSELPAAAVRPAGDPMKRAASARRTPRRCRSRREEQQAIIEGAAGAGAGGRRRRLRQDRDDGGPGGLPGRERPGPARPGARPDLHPQGGRPARPAGPAPGCGAVGGAGRRPARPRTAASRTSAPTTRSAAGSSTTSEPLAGIEPARGGAHPDGVLAAGAAGGRPLGRRPGHRSRPGRRHRAPARDLRHPRRSPDRRDGARRVPERPAGHAAQRPAEPRGNEARCTAGWPSTSSGCRTGAGSCRSSAPTPPRSASAAWSTSPTRCSWRRPSSRAIRGWRPRSASGTAVVLLDEYQDTGHAQRVILRTLFGHGADADRRPAPAGPGTHPVIAVGDPVQSIYSWRGASASNLPRFATDFPARGGIRRRPLPLLTSFRNARRVLDVANEVSMPVRRPRPAPLQSASCARGRPRRTARSPYGLFETVADEDAWVAERIARPMARRRGRGDAAADDGGARAAAQRHVRRRRRAASARACRSRSSASADCSTSPRSPTWSRFSACWWTRGPGRRCCGCSPGRGGCSAWRTSRRWPGGRGSSPRPATAQPSRRPPARGLESARARPRRGDRRRARRARTSTRRRLIDAIDDPGPAGRYSARGSPPDHPVLGRTAPAPVAAAPTARRTWSPSSSRAIGLDVEVQLHSSAGSGAPRRVRAGRRTTSPRPVPGPGAARLPRRRRRAGGRAGSG